MAKPTFEEFVRFIDGALIEDKEMTFGGYGVPSDIGSESATFYREATIEGRTERLVITIAKATGQ